MWRFANSLVDAKLSCKVVRGSEFVIRDNHVKTARSCSVRQGPVGPEMGLPSAAKQHIMSLSSRIVGKSYLGYFRLARRLGTKRTYAGFSPPVFVTSPTL
jgi:hypothetical protein